MNSPILYAAQVTPLSEPALYQQAYAMVSSARREKTDRYRLKKDRLLSLGAELLLLYGLECSGQDASAADLCYGPENKPFFKDGPCHFNLSHSGTWAVCALGECELGCDVEEILPVDLRLAKRFHPEEYKDIFSQQTEAKQLELFYRYWTLKESFMKATGLGMKLPLDSFQMVRGENDWLKAHSFINKAKSAQINAPAEREEKIYIIQSVDKRDYDFREFSDIPGYCCALCSAKDCSHAELRVVDLKEILNKK